MRVKRRQLSPRSAIQLCQNIPKRGWATEEHEILFIYSQHRKHSQHHFISKHQQDWLRVNMIDPFTLATGLAGLISLALELGKITREYQQAFQTTHDVVDDFISELKTLEDILKNLEHFLNASPARQISFSNSSCLCVTTGLCKKSLEHILTRLRSNRPKGRAISIVRRIRWPFDKQEIEQTIQNIRAYAHTFQFALTLDGWYDLSSPIAFFYAHFTSKILAHASDEVSTILRSQLQTLEAAKEVAKAVPTLLESTKEASQHLQGVLSLLVDSHARGDQIEGIATWIKELKVKDASKRR